MSELSQEKNSKERDVRPVDAHCHLEFEDFDDDRDEVVEEVEKRLQYAVIAGCSRKDNEKAMRVAERSGSLKYCLGMHPLYHQDTSVRRVRKQIERNKPVAVGEIGLDHNYITEEKEREESEKAFRKMLGIAEEENLSAVIHSRNAEKKAFEITKEYNVKCFFHCFNGAPDLAEEIASEGHLIGVTGQIFHSKRVQNVVEKIEVGSMLLETDSPYLGVEDRNTPMLVEDIAREVANIKGLTSEEVVQKTCENSDNFFQV